MILLIFFKEYFFRIEVMYLQQKQKQKKNQKKNKFFEHIENESEGVNYASFNYRFDFVKPSDLAEKLFEIKDKKKNNDFVEETKNRWSKLKDVSKKMSEEKKINEKPDKILKIVEEILNSNKKIQNQTGEGLKIVTPNQMPSRLPISLAQLEAGNNSEKLKNEIRQLLYSLYRSKNVTK